MANLLLQAISMVKLRHLQLEGKNLANCYEFANIAPLQIFHVYGSHDN